MIRYNTLEHLHKFCFILPSSYFQNSSQKTTFPKNFLENTQTDAHLTIIIMLTVLMLTMTVEEKLISFQTTHLLEFDLKRL